MFWWVVCLCGGNGLGSWLVFIVFMFLDSTNSFFVINVTVFAIP